MTNLPEECVHRSRLHRSEREGHSGPSLSRWHSHRRIQPGLKKKNVLRPDDQASRSRELRTGGNSHTPWNGSERQEHRGRSCYRRSVQVAEYYLRKESGCLGFNDFKLLGSPARNGDVTVVLFEARADGSRRRVEYVTVRDAWRQRLTCDSADQSAVWQYRLTAFTVET